MRAQKLSENHKILLGHRYKYLTVYAFSTENWKRPEDEVSALMKLFKSYLNEALEDFKDDSIVVKFIGDISGKTLFS